MSTWKDDRWVLEFMINLPIEGEVYGTLTHKKSAFCIYDSAATADKCLKKMRATANKRYRALRHTYLVVGHDQIRALRDGYKDAAAFLNQCLKETT